MKRILLYLSALSTSAIGLAHGNPTVDTCSDTSGIQINELRLIQKSIDSVVRLDSATVIINEFKCNIP